MPSDHTENNLEHLEENNHIGFPTLIPDLFTSVECKQIIKLSKKLPLEDGVVGKGKASGSVNLYKRNSKIKWMSPRNNNVWIFERIQQATIFANKAYQFELAGCYPLQITQYPIGGNYKWHIDVGDGATSIRKLSMSIQLSNSASYEGGDLSFMNGDKCPGGDDRRKQGSAICFPSYLPHQVSSVTKGLRWAMVAWVYGPAFR